MPTTHDIRALMASRFDAETCCLECGDNCERWRLTNGICPACAELEAEAEALKATTTTTTGGNHE